MSQRHQQLPRLSDSSSGENPKVCRMLGRAGEGRLVATRRQIEAFCTLAQQLPALAIKGVRNTSKSLLAEMSKCWQCECALVRVNELTNIHFSLGNFQIKEKPQAFLSISLKSKKKTHKVRVLYEFPYWIQINLVVDFLIKQSISELINKDLYY